MTKVLIGADIGGSHITCMGIDLLGHSMPDVFKTGREIDNHASSDNILGVWSEALRELIGLIGKENLGGIGFAMPGPFDYPAGIAWFKGVQKFEKLYGVNVRKEIRNRLSLDESVPIRFLNDASCFAIGEAWTGRAAGFSKNVAITLGTGFGSAFIADGISVESGPDVPEFGWVYHLPFGGSIADDHFSTRWFIRRYKTVTGEDIPGVKELSEVASSEYSRDWIQPGTSVNTQNMIQHPASRIFTEFGTNLGKFMAPLLMKFDARCLTIGGNIANAYPFFETPFILALNNLGCNIPVFVTELGELAAIAGAARLCDDSFYTRLPFNSDK